MKAIQDMTYAEIREANIAMMSRYLDAVNAWDFKVIGDLLADTIFFELPFAPDPFPKSVSGHKAVMEFLTGIPSFAEEENLYDINIDTLAADPNEIIVHCKSDMKLTNGREYKNRYVIRASVSDGEIVHFAEYFDSVPLIRAIGGDVIIPEDPDMG